MSNKCGMNYINGRYSDFLQWSTTEVESSVFRSILGVDAINLGLDFQ